MPKGLALATAVGVAGAANPDITAAIAAMGDQQWHTIDHRPWSDGTALAALTAELATRADGMHQIEGQAWTAFTGSQGSLAALGETQNSAYLSITETVGPTPGVGTGGA